MNDPARLTDRELYEAISAGDAGALAEMARRHARGLYDFALRGTLDEQQSAAVMDSVFRRIREPSTQVPSQIDFRTWLYSLCLVEVLAVSNETRTARISTDDERFYQRPAEVDLEIAHWSWQAARGLRTRDYCVLDLTLRRGLTPEEVAEAASLTRSNLYASIGRARGAFEETFAAMLLFERGRDACPILDEMVENAPGMSLRPALRHQIIEHADDCDACRITLDSLPPAANVYIALVDVEMPEPLLRRVLAGESLPAPSVEPEVVAPAAFGVSAAAAALAAGEAELEPSLAEPEIVPAPLESAAAFEEPEVAEEPEEPPVAEEEAPIFAESPEAVEPPIIVPDVFAPEIDGSDVEDTETVDEPESEDESNEAPEIEPELVAAPATTLLRPALEPVPVTPVRRDDLDYDDGEVYETVSRRSLLDRVKGQQLLWTYMLLGVTAAVAIYLGFAVADSLQSGGADSGAVPLDATPNASVAREIDCGDTPVEMDEGTFTIVSFEETALDGYRIKTLSYAPVSDQAEFTDIEATMESAFSIRFVAKDQEATEPRTEEFELRIQWERGEESASSTCQLLVNVQP